MCRGARGIGLNILDGFLERAHGGAEFVDVVAGLLDEVFMTVWSGDLGGKILLAGAGK